MRLLLTITFIFFGFYFLKSQSIENSIRKQTIENFQDYLIENPWSPEIIEITDTLRALWDKENLENYHSFCLCNCISLYINPLNELLLNGEPIDTIRLKDELYQFIKHEGYSPPCPEPEIYNSDYFGAVYRTKGTIDLISQNANPEFYSEIIEIAKSVFHEIRNEWAVFFYKTDYHQLTTEEQLEIDKLTPIRIRFERYMPYRMRLPYPPAPKIMELEVMPTPDNY